MKDIITHLNERLDEPFVTAGTVTGDKGIKTCASRMQTSSLDLLRRRQVYPMGGESETGRFTRCPSSDRGPGLRAAHQHDRLSEGSRVSRSITAPMALAQSQPQVIVQESKDLKEIIARLNERLDEPFVTAGTVTGDKGIKTCASRKPNELARFAEALPSLSNQAQDEYQRLMNNKIVIK